VNPVLLSLVAEFNDSYISLYEKGVLPKPLTHLYEATTPDLLNKCEQVYQGIALTAEQVYQGVALTAEQVYQGIALTAEQVYQGIALTAEQVYQGISLTAEQDKTVEEKTRDQN